MSRKALSDHRFEELPIRIQEALRCYATTGSLNAAAEIAGVQEISVRRWVCGLGVQPPMLKEHIDRLKSEAAQRNEAGFRDFQDKIRADAEGAWSKLVAMVEDPAVSERVKLDALNSILDRGYVPRVEKSEIKQETKAFSQEDRQQIFQNVLSLVKNKQAQAK